MGRTIYLGYTCPKCCTRVPVYTFTNVNGEIDATPPIDQRVVCSHCHFPRTVSFAGLQHLDRWERPATALPPKPAADPASVSSCREFTRGAGIPLDYRRAQLVKGNNGCVYVVSPDGTTIIFRDDSAKELCEKYLEQSRSDPRDFSIRLTLQVAAPSEQAVRETRRSALPDAAQKQRPGKSRAHVANPDSPSFPFPEPYLTVTSVQPHAVAAVIRQAFALAVEKKTARQAGPRSATRN